MGHPSHGCADSRNGGRGVEALWGIGRGDPQDGIAWLATRLWVESSRLIPGVLGGGWSVCNWGGEPTKGEQVVCVCASVIKLFKCTLLASHKWIMCFSNKFSYNL